MLACVGSALLAPAALATNTANGAPSGPKCTTVGTSGNDRLFGTPGHDVVCGRGGNDVIHADAGKDVLYGGPGKDRIDGGPGNDVIHGGGGNDRLVGAPGNDRLVAGTGQDHLFGGKGRDALLGGLGDDTNIEGPIVKNLQGQLTFQVNVKPTYDVPRGTVVTWKPLGGTCIKEAQSDSQTIVPPNTGSAFRAFFGVTGNLWEGCAWTRSNSWFRVNFKTPKGNEWFRDINVTQTSLPTVVEHTFLADCQSGNALCHGGTDTSIGQGLVEPPIKFGPLRDPQLPQDPTLQCKGVSQFSVGDTLKDFHPCTSEGNPLPELSYEGSMMPASIKASRYPDPEGSWIVLNGRFDKPGRYFLRVKAELYGHWVRTDEAVFAVSG